MDHKNHAAQKSFKNLSTEIYTELFNNYCVVQDPLIHGYYSGQNSFKNPTKNIYQILQESLGTGFR